MVLFIIFLTVVILNLIVYIIHLKREKNKLTIRLRFASNRESLLLKDRRADIKYMSFLENEVIKLSK